MSGFNIINNPDLPMIDKDPDATLDYTWDWSQWLASDDSIVSQVVTVDSSLTLGAVTQVGGKVTAIIGGGGHHMGAVRTASCKVTTFKGLIDERSIGFRIIGR